MNRTKKAAKLSVWAIMQSATAYAAYQGVHGHAIWWNLYRFGAWLMPILWFSSMLGLSMANGQTLEKSRRVAPLWLSCLSDLAIGLVCAAYGHFFYAALKVVEQFLEQTTYSTVEARLEKLNQVAE